MDRYRKEVLQVSTRKHGINVQYLYDIYVTRPFCLVESHIVKTLDKADVLCFTSYTFCNNDGSCSLRLTERIYIYLIELAVMINLHNLVLKKFKLCQKASPWSFKHDVTQILTFTPPRPPHRAHMPWVFCTCVA